MTDAYPLRVKYDPESDVLYLNLNREISTRGVEDSSGIVWRYKSDGALIGATLVDYQHIQSVMGEATLNRTLSQHFNLSLEETKNVLSIAINRAKKSAP